MGVPNPSSQMAHLHLVLAAVTRSPGIFIIVRWGPGDLCLFFAVRNQNYGGPVKKRFTRHKVRARRGARNRVKRVATPVDIQAI
jgi:hypothetical protein